MLGHRRLDIFNPSSNPDHSEEFYFVAPLRLVAMTSEKRLSSSLLRPSDLVTTSGELIRTMASSTTEAEGGGGASAAPVPVADLLGGGGADDDDDDDNAAATTPADTSPAGTADAGTADARAGGAEETKLDEPTVVSIPPAAAAEAPETPSEKLTRGFAVLGAGTSRFAGAVGGIGGSLGGIGRGIKAAVANPQAEYDTSAGASSASGGGDGEGAGAPDEEVRQSARSGRSGGGASSGIIGAAATSAAATGTGNAATPSSAAAPYPLKRTPSMNAAMQRQQQQKQSRSGPPPNRQNSNPLTALTSLTSGIATLTTSIGDGLTSTTVSIGTNLSRGLTTRQYTMPDRTVASQVLMYRQLLHTECKPGLRLSRAYEGTPAQVAVKHMPWWEQGVEKTKRMVISYDNLIVRLWLSGAIMPYVEGGYAHKVDAAPTGEEHRSALAAEQQNGGSGDGAASSSNNTDHVDTLIDSKGLPPIPHQYWVDRLGFQQTDPVTDFRSGGVLSLAMLVHVVEACPHVHCRFLPDGPAHMLPFGITCINITDMLAKFLMFSKSVDRIDALLSQKPFWRMFGDPNSLLVCQEISMDMLADVVVEMKRERQIPGGKHETGDSLHGEREGKVTVFDFAEILERTEKRVRDDLLGAGPKSVPELRAVHARIKKRYERAMERKERDAERRYGKASNPVAAGAGAILGKITGDQKAEVEKPAQKVTAIEEVAFGDSYDEVESSTPSVAAAKTEELAPSVAAAKELSSHATLDVAAAPPPEPVKPAIQEQSTTASTLSTPPAAAAATAPPPDLLGGDMPAAQEEEGDFLGSDAGVPEFSIGDEEEENEGVLDFLDQDLL